MAYLLVIHKKYKTLLYILAYKSRNLDKLWTLFSEFDVYASLEIYSLKLHFLTHFGKKLYVRYFETILFYF